jgi:hypothetical protein
MQFRTIWSVLATLRQWQAHCARGWLACHAGGHHPPEEAELKATLQRVIELRRRPIDEDADEKD